MMGDLDYAKQAADFSQALESKFMLVSGREAGRKINLKMNYKAMADILNQVGEICQERGLTYVYHNHWYEITK